MVRAELYTRHFTFHAYGNDKAHALDALRRGWNSNHVRNYPGAPTFDQYLEAEGGEVEYTTATIGTAYRDNEEMK